MHVDWKVVYICGKVLRDSQAYNLALDYSDYDWIGMYLADIDDVLSFEEPIQTLTKV